MNTSEISAKPWGHRIGLAVLVILLNVAGAVVLQADAGASGTPLSGAGSALAAPVIESWLATVAGAPYNLSLSYANTDSGTGREWFTNQMLKTLTANPDVWSKTVLFHMYDENDGFFDHVPPPVAPHGTPGESVTVSPLPGDSDGMAGPVGMGFRVPMLVLSPFSRGGHVASQVFDHTSQLRFLEERFGVKAPNISAWRRKVAGDLTSALHLRSGDASVPTLPSTSKDQTANVLAEGCTNLSIIEAAPDSAMPVYPVPAQQSMPHQETA